MSTDVNILLLGQTGVGKTTFINAFANYLVHHSLEDAMGSELQAPIPASFIYTDPETYDEVQINAGIPCESEQAERSGGSVTMECRSFIFQMKNNRLRFIDTPLFGDTSRPAQDVENLKHIISFISQYEHLNGICILLKPNEDRLTIVFRYCVQQLLRHLHIEAKDNVMFVFTNARLTNFLVGGTARTLRQYLNALQNDFKIAIPFSKENTFSLDNEAFRFLALCKNGINVDPEERNTYSHSWSHTIKEFERMMKKIVQCRKHNTRDTVSLNEAQQLIRKLSRAIEEINFIIERHIALVNQHNKSTSILTSQQKFLEQVDIDIIELAYPRLVCTNDSCTKVTLVNGIEQVNYATHCHPQCYLYGIENNVIGHEKIRSCPMINTSSGRCIKCNCDWKTHMHITYESRKVLQKTAVEDKAVIGHRLTSLKSEKDAILRVCGQLASFIRNNSMCPVNDDILEYIPLVIEEEERKKNFGAKNDEVIAALEKLEYDCKKEKELMQQLMNNTQNNLSNLTSTLTPQQISALVENLYQLPLYGRQIRVQVENIRMAPHPLNGEKEIIVKLPLKAESSPMMKALRSIMV